MDKIEVDPNQEIIITVGDLLTLIDGMAHLSKEISNVLDKITENEARKITVPMIATFVCISDLFPREQKKQIFAGLKDIVGIDFTELFK